MTPTQKEPTVEALSVNKQNIRSYFVNIKKKAANVKQQNA